MTETLEEFRTRNKMSYKKLAVHITGDDRADAKVFYNYCNGRRKPRGEDMMLQIWERTARKVDPNSFYPFMQNQGDVSHD